MWRAAALLTIALAITGCGKTSPTAPSAAGSEQVEPRRGIDAPDNTSHTRGKTDDHVEPPGVLPPG